MASLNDFETIDEFLDDLRSELINDGYSVPSLSGTVPNKIVIIISAVEGGSASLSGLEGGSIATHLYTTDNATQLTSR